MMRGFPFRSGWSAMRACVQRVSRAQVSVDNQVIGQTGRGLVVLVGVAAGDDEKDVHWMAERVVHLRIFPDDEGKMNRSLKDVGGEMLAISQFTLFGDARKGLRPSFIAAADPETGNRLYHDFIHAVRGMNIVVAEGRFRADMQVELVNDGPVTILLDSRKAF